MGLGEEERRGRCVWAGCEPAPSFQKGHHLHRAAHPEPSMALVPWWGFLMEKGKSHQWDHPVGVSGHLCQTPAWCWLLL